MGFLRKTQNFPLFLFLFFTKTSKMELHNLNKQTEGASQSVVRLHMLCPLKTSKSTKEHIKEAPDSQTKVI